MGNSQSNSPPTPTPLHQPDRSIAALNAVKAAVTNYLDNGCVAVDGTLLKAAILHGYSFHQIREQAKQIQRLAGEATNGDANVISDEEEERIASLMEDNIANMKVKRVTAVHEDATRLINGIKDGKLIMKKVSIADAVAAGGLYNVDASLVETQPIPHIDTITAEQLNSSHPPTMLAVSVKCSASRTMETFRAGYPMYHSHAAAMEIDLTTMVATAIEISEMVMGGQKLFRDCNPLVWNNQANDNAFRTLWDVNTPGMHVNIPGMPALNLPPTMHDPDYLKKPPQLSERCLPIYQSSQFNGESLPDVWEIVDRLNPHRYSYQVVEPCLHQQMADGGKGYFDDLKCAVTMSPGNMVQDMFMCTRPHFYDKKTLQGAYNNARLTTMGVQARSNILLQRLREHLDIWRATDPRPENDRLVSGDDGQFLYSCSTMIQAIVFHLTKTDRKHFHGIGMEFGNGQVIQQLENDMVIKSVWEPFNQSTTNNEQMLRSRLPIPQKSSIHMIHGSVTRPITGGVLIKYFDEYRPLRNGDIWYFEWVPVSRGVAA